MEDKEIINLYRQRNPAAIEETHIKYGRWCRKVAYNILRNNQDTEECMNDVYLTAWNYIPTQPPINLGSWLTRVTQNLSLDRLRTQTSCKRGSGRTDLCLEEITDCLASDSSVEQSYEAKEMVDCINLFLYSLSHKDRMIFVHRYWCKASCAEIAELMECTTGNVRLSLFRTRKKLNLYLKAERLI